MIAPEDPGPGVEVAATGPFQRRNFALATAAAEAFLGEVDPEKVAAVAAGLTVPGRLELIAESPPTYVDAAHNPDGAAALAEALPGIAAGRPVVACLAILADKDAPAMIAALAPALRSVVCTEIPPAALQGHGRPGARSRPAAGARRPLPGLRARSERRAGAGNRSAPRHRTRLRHLRRRPRRHRFALPDRSGAGLSGNSHRAAAG